MQCLFVAGTFWCSLLVQLFSRLGAAQQHAAKLQNSALRDKSPPVTGSCCLLFVLPLGIQRTPARPAAGKSQLALSCKAYFAGRPANCGHWTAPLVSGARAACASLCGGSMLRRLTLWAPGAQVSKEWPDAEAPAKEIAGCAAHVCTPPSGSSSIVTISANDMSSPTSGKAVTLFKQARSRGPPPPQQLIAGHHSLSCPPVTRGIAAPPQLWLERGMPCKLDLCDGCAVLWTKLRGVRRQVEVPPSAADLLLGAGQEVSASADEAEEETFDAQPRTKSTALVPQVRMLMLPALQQLPRTASGLAYLAPALKRPEQLP